MALNINSVLLREVFSYKSGIFLVEVMLLFAVKIFIFVNSGTFCNKDFTFHIFVGVSSESALPAFSGEEIHDNGA